MVSRRGQVSGQIFIYIAGIIIVGAVILFGARMFSTLEKTSETYVSMEFQNKIRSDVDSLIGSYGSYSTNKYVLPKEFNKICFIDTDADLIYIKNYPIIYDSVKAGSNNNVFLFGPGTFGAFYVKNLGKFESPYVSCSDAIRGVCEVKLFSLGDTVFANTGAYKPFCEAASISTFNNQPGCFGLDIVYYSGYESDCCNRYKICCSS